MTSGLFYIGNLDEIKVNRDARQRKEIKDIPVLADSIRRLGLIHPIVITRDLVLVAGERRMAAARSLGWDKIACQFVDELSDVALKTIELEENVKRVNLTWQEECRAIEEYHSVMKEQNEAWNQELTAAALGLDQSTIARKLQVATELKNGTIDASIPRFSTARGIVERREARAVEAADLKRHEIEARTGPQSILNLDFNHWADTYSGPQFNFIHCDFPYGIDANKMQQGGSVATHGGYDDSEEVYWSLLTSLLSNIDNICAESCHIMFWFSMHYYASTLDYFKRNSDFAVDPFPLIWLKSDNIGLLPDPQRGPRRIYETALFGSRGDRKIVSSVSNAYASPTDRSTHMSAKPVAVLQHFFRMFVDASTTMLDPTCGGGSALRAAEFLNAKSVLGIERDKEFADRAILALEASRRMK